MRDSLTVLAILVIAVLTAALVGPYLVDWNSQRALIEAKLSEAVGLRVKVAGRIDVKILPRPIFRFAGITVDDPAPGHPRLTVEAARIEVSLAALMRGHVQVVQTTLWMPRLDLEERPGGQLDLPLPPAAMAERIEVQNLKIQQGALSVTLADGRRLAFGGIDLDAEATTLRGPFKVSGRLGPEQGAVPFRLATGSAERDRMLVRLQVEGDALRPAIDLDGALVRGLQPAASGEGAAAPVEGPGFEGTAAASGTLALAGTPAGIPWRFTTRLAAGPGSAALSQAELRAGADMRALIANGDGTARYGAGTGAPDVALRLHGAGLDLDRLAVVPEALAVAPPGGMDLVRMLFGLATREGASLAAPLGLSLAVDVDTTTVGGQTWRAMGARIGLGAGADAAVAFTVAGPDGARLGLDGRIEPGPSAVFRGHVEAQTDEFRRTLALLVPAIPELAAGRDLPSRAVAISGDVAFSGVGLAAHHLALRLDRSRLSGMLSYTRAVAPEPPRLFAELSADQLDIDALPDLSGVAAATQGLDLSLDLSAKSTRLSDAALVSGLSGALDAGALQLKLTRKGDAFELRRLAIALDGATVEASGSFSAREGRGEGRVRAERLEPLAATLRRVLPGPLTTALAERAAALSPFDGTLRVEANAAPGAGLLPTRATIEGTAAETRFGGTLVPDPVGDGRDPASRSVMLSIKADAPEAAAFLRQLGTTVAAAPSLGPAHLEATAHGALAAGFAAKGAATLGSAALAFEGRAGVDAVAGRATLRAPDLRPLLAAVGLVARTPDPAVLPVEAGADLAWGDDRLSLHRLAAKVGGTSASGDLAVDLAPSKAGETDRPILVGDLAVDRLSVEALASLALGPPADAGASPAGPPFLSSKPFGPPAVALPRAEIALKVGAFPLFGGLVGEAVSMKLRGGGAAVRLADVAGGLRGGTFGGALALRRDGATADVTGRVTARGIAFDLGGLSGRVDGAQDFAGSGDSLAALVASLGGTGRLTLAGATLSGTDPLALARTAATFAKREAAAATGAPLPEAASIRKALADDLGRGPLRLGDQAVSATLASGVLRTGPLRAEDPGPPAGSPRRDGSRAGWSAESDAAIDLATFGIVLRTRLHPRIAGSSGAGGDLVAVRSGTLGGILREVVDAAEFVNLMQAGAIARAQERIEIFEQDVRERAYFNRVLKAIEADRQAARERAKAEAEAAKAAAEVRRTELARQRIEDARVRAEIEAAARDALSEGDRQRFEEMLKGVAVPPVRSRSDGATPGPADAPPTNPRKAGAKGPRNARGLPLDLVPPSAGSRDRAPVPVDPSTSGRY